MEGLSKYGIQPKRLEGKDAKCYNIKKLHPRSGLWNVLS